MKNLAPISNTRKKSIVSVDLKSGMRGKCQVVFLNSQIEVKKNCYSALYFFCFLVNKVLHWRSHFKKICFMSSQLFFFPVHPNYWWYLKFCIVSQIHQMQLLICCQSCLIQIISSLPKANRPDILTSLCPVSFTSKFSFIDFVFFCVSWDLTSFFQNILAPPQ